MSERRGRRRAHGAALVWVIVLNCSAVEAMDKLGPRGLGRAPDVATIAAQDIAIGSRGSALPPGRGTVSEGAALYAAKCALCHGEQGHEGPDPALVGGQGSLASDSPLLTIGSYWPYATTVYDYIYRAMPFMQPGSLRADEVYALTAYLLHANGIVAADAVIDRTSLPAVSMPNRDGFIADTRPDLPWQQLPEGGTGGEHDR